MRQAVDKRILNKNIQQANPKDMLHIAINKMDKNSLPDAIKKITDFSKTANFFTITILKN